VTPSSVAKMVLALGDVVQRQRGADDSSVY
jgi:hypothetical protein